MDPGIAGLAWRASAVRQVVAWWVLVLLSGISEPARSQEVVLRAVSAFPRQITQSEDFQRFIDMVNAQGVGVLRIQLIGGPESVPPPEQGAALARGIVDLQFGPPTFYAGSFPEADAFSGDLLPARRIREGGGERLIDTALERRINAKLLAFAGGGVGIHLFTAKAPRIGPDGQPDLSGVRMRSAPLFVDLIRRLGGTPVVMPQSDVHTALERGMVSGVGWSLMGVSETGWTQFLRYRIEPAMYRSSILIIINRDRWRSLSERAREVLQRVALAYELALETHYAKRQALEIQQLETQGLQTYQLGPDAAKAFQRAAFDTMWSRIEANPSTRLDLPAVKAAFYGR